MNKLYSEMVQDQIHLIDDTIKKLDENTNACKANLFAYKEKLSRTLIEAQFLERMTQKN